MIDTVNGVKDHLHCLMALKADWSIAKQMQMIKGESAWWVNKSGLLKTKLEWADEYYAASVSHESLLQVRAYIRHQEEHHRKKIFVEEYETFLKEWAKARCASLSYTSLKAGDINGRNPLRSCHGSFQLAG
jgi:putative transposase